MERETAHSAGAGLGAWPRALRCSHWLKNVFVLVPIIFAGQWLSIEAWWRGGLAFGTFCLLSSAVYLLNDLADRQADRQHPTKRYRPIASGQIGPVAAGLAAVVLAAGGGMLAMLPQVVAPMAEQPLHGWGLVLWAGAYLLVNLLYSLWLKRYSIIDVICVASGFVLRAMAGAAAIGVPISPWLVVCTFTLCLYIALSKRRAEIALLDAEGITDRGGHLDLHGPELDRMLTISASLAVITYVLYCLAPRTVAQFGSAHMIWTIPFVLYGVFRYDRVSRRLTRADVVQVLLADPVLWAVVAGYLAVALAVIGWGNHPAVAPLLHGSLP